MYTGQYTTLALSGFVRAMVRVASWRHGAARERTALGLRRQTGRRAARRARTAASVPPPDGRTSCHPVLRRAGALRLLCGRQAGCTAPNPRVSRVRMLPWR